MDEAFSTEHVTTLPLGMGDIRALWAAGTIRNRHAFECPNCRFPLKLCSIEPHNKVEPYLKICDQDTCLDAVTPRTGHDNSCDFWIDENSGERSDDYEREVDNQLVRVKSGSRLQVYRKRTQTETAPFADERGPRVTEAQRRNHPKWGLWRIVNELKHWDAPEIHDRYFELGEPRPALDVFRRIDDLADIELKTWPPGAPIDAYTNIDYSETKHIFFGTATVRPMPGGLGRVFFERPFKNGSEERTVTISLESYYRDISKHLRRFDTMLKSIGFDNTAPRKCLVFVLGTMRHVTNDRYMNLKLARTLEDIVILPIGDSNHARLLAQLLEAERNSMLEYRAREAERKRQAREALEAEYRLQYELEEEARKARIAAESAERSRREQEERTQRERAAAAERERQKRAEADEQARQKRVAAERELQREREAEQYREKMRIAEIRAAFELQRRQSEGLIQRIWRMISGS